NEPTRKLEPNSFAQVRVNSWIGFSSWFAASAASLLRGESHDPMVQGPELDYSKFIHKSQRHSSLACTACHERSDDNSATPRFPGHKFCTNCHLTQFVTPAVPLCLVCHTN